MQGNQAHTHDSVTSICTFNTGNNIKHNITNQWSSLVSIATENWSQVAIAVVKQGQHFNNALDNQANGLLTLTLTLTPVC